MIDLNSPREQPGNPKHWYRCACLALYMYANIITLAPGTQHAQGICTRRTNPLPLTCLGGYMCTSSAPQSSSRRYTSRQVDHTTRAKEKRYLEVTQALLPTNSSNHGQEGFLIVAVPIHRRERTRISSTQHSMILLLPFLTANTQQAYSLDCYRYHHHLSSHHSVERPKPPH